MLHDFALDPDGWETLFCIIPSTMVLEDHFIFGFARSGVYNKVYSYPSVLDSTDRSVIGRDDSGTTVMGNSFGNMFSYPDFMNKSTQGMLSGDIEIIPNGAELIQRPARFLKVIEEELWKTGFSRLIYVQGISDPYILPALIYSGVSFIDDSFARMESEGKIKYTIFGRKKVDYDPLEENLEFLRSVAEQCAEAIKSGTLRDIVEKFQVSSKAIELLRIMDFNYYDEFEKVFPSRTDRIRANSIESLMRPDLVRYRDQLVRDFVPPAGKIALLIPCSARKPYSESRSHMKLLTHIGEFRKFLHEIIITSPVGLVPRELEEGYPARFYDIPVIGHWYEDEKTMMAGLISRYFGKNSYPGTIAFVPEDLEFIERSLPDGTDFIRGEISSSGDLETLREKIGSMVVSLKEKGMLVPGTRMQAIASMASFQFGEWIVPRMKNLKRVVNYDFDLLTESGKVMLVYNPSNGKITLNRNAAPWFVAEGKRIVEIDDFKPTANIYAMGVLNATPDIRQEDEVVIVHGGEIRGVGIAKMPYEAMINLKKGIAVKVRN